MHLSSRLLPLHGLWPLCPVLPPAPAGGPSDMCLSEHLHMQCSGTADVCRCVWRCMRDLALAKAAARMLLTNCCEGPTGENPGVGTYGGVYTSTATCVCSRLFRRPKQRKWALALGRASCRRGQRLVTWSRVCTGSLCDASVTERAMNEAWVMAVCSTLGPALCGALFLCGQHAVRTHRAVSSAGRFADPALPLWHM
jgi:hypothetical protein